MKRIDGKTPNGGVYIEIYTYDKEGNQTDEEDKIYKTYICEYDERDNLIFETFSINEDNKSKKKQ